jgi:hypothetical protein
VSAAPSIKLSHSLTLSTVSGDARSSWERLSEVAVKGAQFDSPERRPHPKCMQGTRIDILNYIHGLLDDQVKSRIIWLHGTAGVGKSAVAFTVAERMRGLKVTERTTDEKRLAGSFFFSRKHTKRCTTGYFFATLAYQLATNFPSIQDDVNRAIRQNPALLDPDNSLHDQMETLFLQPLRKLYFRLRNTPPPVFVIDALDECTSETEIADFICLLGQALRESDVPVIHILLTSRSEAHIHDAIQEEGVRSLVCEIPVKTHGEGVSKIISLDGVDVDNDIYIFLTHSFRKFQSRCSNFPQPTTLQLAQLANRAGRRFIVASTMMKFIHDGYNDPRGRLQLMLEQTSKLLPGTEVYKLYDRILSTCSDPMRAYLHLSVVAALADPLPISQISELLGPGEGRDLEATLKQLRSVMDIPTDSSLPVNIYHSSVRDYVSNPSNCSLHEVQHGLTSPHSLLARSSLGLMIDAIPANTALLDALVELKEQSQAIPAENPRRLKYTLSFIVQLPEPLQVLICLLWLRGVRGPGLQCWLGDQDGRSWLQTKQGKDWLGTQDAQDWLKTQAGEAWLQMWMGKAWLQTRSGHQWLQSSQGWMWTQRWPTVAKDLIRHEWLGELETQCGDQLETVAGERLDEDPEREQLQALAEERLDEYPKRMQLQIPAEERRDEDLAQEHLEIQPEQSSLSPLQSSNWVLTLDERRCLWASNEWLWTTDGQKWLQTQGEKGWLEILRVQEWLETPNGQKWLETPSEQKWLETLNGREWLKSQNGREWLETPNGREWLETPGEQKWLETLNEQKWLDTPNGQEWLKSPNGREWLETPNGREWLETPNRREWLMTLNGREWLMTPNGQEWLKTPNVRDWVKTPSGQVWLKTLNGREWLKTPNGREWLGIWCGRYWLQTEGRRQWAEILNGQYWLQTPNGQYWLQTPNGQYWLQTEGGQQWVETPNGQYWLQTPRGLGWLQTERGQKWLQTPGVQKWLQILSGQEWLQTPSGRNWLQTQGARKWLQVPSGREWLHAWGGREWLQTLGGREWLQTSAVEEWLQTQGGERWLQTQSGQDWLLIQNGQNWLHTSGGRNWLQTSDGRDWLHTWDGREWLQTHGGQAWLQIMDMQYLLRTQSWEDWLQSPGGRDWLQSPSGRDWMRTPDGQAWQLTSVASIWVMMEDFSSTLEAIYGYTITRELPLSPAFQVIQHFKSLPDFLMFPAFLALMHRSGPISAFPHDSVLPDIDIIHAMTAFRIFADEARERSRSASDALKYACQNFTMHLSQAPKPWDDTLQHTFKSFWNDHLVSWLERQWCLKGLRSCLVILSEGQKLAKVCSISDDFHDSTPDLLLGTSPSPSLTVIAVSGLKLSNLCKTATTRRSLSFTGEKFTSMTISKLC